MATKTIAWTTGSGNITLTYTGQGSGSISVSSSENDSFDDRSQSFNIVTTNVSPEQAVSILVKQKGKTYPVGEVFNFEYTGSVQQITLPKGKYKLQCWGAQGGNVTGSYAVDGSKGGYSEGIITLTKTTTFYIFVGGQGTSYTSSASQTSTTSINGGWNGGGSGVRTASYSVNNESGKSFPRGGGGATDISTVTSSMSYSSGRTNRSSASLLARCIVAGGGAGASARYTSITETVENGKAWEVIFTESMTITEQNSTGYGTYMQVSYITNAVIGNTYKVSVNPPSDGANGKFVVIYNNSNAISNGSSFVAESSRIEAHCTVNDKGLGTTFNVTFYEYKTQYTTHTSTSSGKSSTTMQGGGTSGKGIYPGTSTSAGNGGAFGLGANQSSTNYRYCAGGGGGGWYGGGTNRSDTSTSMINYSGGGSGFVNTAANASSRPSGYTGLQLDSGTTTEGSSSFPSTSGGTETGHSGNGYARITVIE